METMEIELLLSLAEAGDDLAKKRYADHYFHHENKQKLPREIWQRVWRYYNDLAETGDAEAMLTLGVIYYEGVNIPQDYTKAREWYERAAEAGSLWAVNNLGYCYYYGREIPVDYERAWHYFGTAAARGNHCGMYKLGDMYYHGKYVAQDYEKALAWYKKAIAVIDASIPEYPNIAARIGKCLVYGQGTAADPLEGFRWLQIAEHGCYRFLMKGDAFAHLSMPGIRQDMEEARKKIEAVTKTMKTVVQYT
ncbi:MAG: tetratricopeptide repeat protein [Eubacterium sp.]|nr:tetratricopeptide repeat protein [Eubacterium sp.]